LNDANRHTRQAELLPRALDELRQLGNARLVECMGLLPAKVSRV
jgi:hypothetical protein